MRIFPSIPAAIVSGAVGVPILDYGWRFIERTFASGWFLVPWMLVAFFIPVIVSTADLKFLAQRYRESGLYSMSVKPGDFRLFYIPAWLRMFVWFVSAAASMLLLEALGVKM